MKILQHSFREIQLTDYKGRWGASASCGPLTIMTKQIEYSSINRQKTSGDALSMILYCIALTTGVCHLGATVSLYQESMMAKTITDQSK